ncbi:MAG: HesA/MoeB/ThiF family protein [archaeon]
MERYCRQAPMIGGEGQKKLLASTVAIVGCGGLGSVCGELLARAGVGSLILIDNDVVDITNLQRQALYNDSDIGKSKALCLKDHLESVNSDVKVSAHELRLDDDNVSEILKADVVLDCTDRVDSRRLINRFCVKNGIPWVHGAAVQSKGEVMNVLPGGPCFECIFPNISQAPSCAEVGILNSTPHVVASLQVVETIKLLLGESPERDLLRLDVYNYFIDRIKIKRNPSCSVCGGENV